MSLFVGPLANRNSGVLNASKTMLGTVATAGKTNTSTIKAPTNYYNQSLYATGRQNTNIVNNPTGTLKNQAVTNPTKATQLYNQNQANRQQAPASSGGSGGYGGGSGGSGGGYSGGGGGGSTGYQAPAWTGPSWTPKLYTAQELAEKYGIVTDQQVYADQLNNATNKYFDQMNTGIVRAENQAYNALAQNYDLVRDDIKQRRQQAYANGATSGQLAAQELAALMGSQQSAGEVATEMLNTQYDLTQQKATTLEENYNLAFQMAQEALANLSNLSQQIYSIDTQRYAADAAGAAQIGAADIGAYGQIAAANASANASRYAADRSAAVQSQLASSDYINNYFNAMYNAQYANQSKYTGNSASSKK